jgi:hypothetical protein
MSTFLFALVLSTALLCSSEHLEQKGNTFKTHRSISLNGINMNFNRLLPTITKLRKPIITCLVAVSFCLPQLVDVNDAAAVGGSLQQGMTLFRKGDVKGSINEFNKATLVYTYYICIHT